MAPKLNPVAVAGLLAQWSDRTAANHGIIGPGQGVVGRQQHDTSIFKEEPVGIDDHRGPLHGQNPRCSFNNDVGSLSIFFMLDWIVNSQLINAH